MIKSEGRSGGRTGLQTISQAGPDLEKEGEEQQRQYQPNGERTRQDGLESVVVVGLAKEGEWFAIGKRYR